MNKIRDNPAIETLFFMTYFLFQSITCREARKVGKIEEGKKGFLSGEKKYLKDLNIAVICDELTYVNFSRECHLYALTPNNWKQVLEDYQIGLFLCESAWEGRKRDHQCCQSICVGFIYCRKKMFSFTHYFHNVTEEQS